VSALPQNTFVVLGCSATKFEVAGQVPAVHLYDGPMYRVLRSHLRTHRWPKELSIGVLSAKHGLIGSLAPIENYDQRMTIDRATSLRPQVTTTLSGLVKQNTQVHLVLGKDYLHSIDSGALDKRASVHCVEGGIGIKLQQFSNLLSSFPSAPRPSAEPSLAANKRPLYFLPDWDDFVDADFDFDKDVFSTARRDGRKEAHTIQLLQPQRICDGVLVSLAQHLGTKGLLRRVPPSDESLMRPRSVRDHFTLAPDQLAFGDCGAFSYAGQHDPAISVDQAIAVYELYEFDLGASVDHIPLREIVDDEGNRTELSEYERKRRVKLTKENAAIFFQTWKAKGCKFTPVGIIQGLDAASYARQVHEYVEMGYTHIALGGLVPRSDEDIRDIVTQVNKVLTEYKHRPWVHLLGVFRPKLQDTMRTSGVNSFDSATYFRKAWLRSDQNYLGADGEWYSAIRVPPTSDPRTLIRLKESGKRESTITKYEKEALKALRRYGKGKLDVESCLDIVLRYDRLLNRGEYSRDSLRKKYRKTLEDRPWTKCSCNVCKDIGVNVLIFRGLNRNKRRGAHNTLQLYNQVLAG
jgi:hypothetical protein